MRVTLGAAPGGLMLAHCLHYPGCEVVGVLAGHRGALDSESVDVTEALPLTHLGLFRSSADALLQAACRRLEAADLTVLGLYYGNEKASPESPVPAPLRDLLMQLRARLSPEAPLLLDVDVAAPPGTVTRPRPLRSLVGDALVPLAASIEVALDVQQRRRLVSSLRWRSLRDADDVSMDPSQSWSSASSLGPWSA